MESARVRDVVGSCAGGADVQQVLGHTRSRGSGEGTVGPLRVLPGAGEVMTAGASVASV